MRVLGIDSSLTGCGLCVVEDDVSMARGNGFNNFSSKTLINNLKGVERILFIENEIINHAKGCDLAVIEGYAFDRKFKGESLAELVGVIKRRLHLMKIPVLIVPTQKVKKILTGHGAKPKEFSEMDTKTWILEETKKHYGIDFDSRDNECEAFGLALIGLAVNRPEKYLGKFERLVVAEINNPKMKIRKTIKYYESVPFKKEIRKITDELYYLYCPGLDFTVEGTSEEDVLKNFQKQKSARIKFMKKNKLKIKITKKFVEEVML